MGRIFREKVVGYGCFKGYFRVKRRGGRKGK